MVRIAVTALLEQQLTSRYPSHGKATRTKHLRVNSNGILSLLFLVFYGWRRGWDSNPTRPFRFCKLQIPQCRRCRKCQGCRRALPAIAR